MRHPALLLCVLLMAGCAQSLSSSTSDVTLSSSSGFEHDYREGDATRELEFPYPGKLSFDATFRGTDALAAGMHVCPSEPQVVLEVLDPDGDVREVVDPDIYGVNGTGGCGGGQREVRVDVPGTWALRFRGQAEMSVDGELRIWSSNRE